MAGGGGMAGSVDYPLYMRTMHGLWLSESNLILQSRLAGASPYAAAFAYNPEGDLDAYLSAYELYVDELGNYGPTNYSSYLTTAGDAVDDEIDPLSVITAEVDALEAGQTLRIQRAVGRMAAGMADASSALTKGFQWAQANLEADALRTLDEKEAELLRERAARRAGYVLAATGQIVGLADNKLSAKRDAARLRGEVSQMTIASQTNRLEAELDFDVRDALWDLSLFTHPANLLASISGGIAQAEHTSRGQQAMSSALGTLSAIGPLVAAL